MVYAFLDTINILLRDYFTSIVQLEHCVLRITPPTPTSTATNPIPIHTLGGSPWPLTPPHQPIPRQGVDIPIPTPYILFGILIVFLWTYHRKSGTRRVWGDATIGEEQVRGDIHNVSKDPDTLYESILESGFSACGDEVGCHSVTVDEDEVDARLEQSQSVGEESVHSPTDEAVVDSIGQQLTHNEPHLHDASNLHTAVLDIPPPIGPIPADEDEAAAPQQLDDEVERQLEGESIFNTPVAVLTSTRQLDDAQRSSSTPPPTDNIIPQIESVFSASADEDEAATQRLPEGDALESVEAVVVLGSSQQFNEGSDSAIGGGEGVAASNELNDARREDCEDSTTKLDEAEDGNVSPASHWSHLVNIALLSTDSTATKTPHDATTNTEDEPLIPTVPSSPVGISPRVLYTIRQPIELPIRANSLSSGENKQPKAISQRQTQSLTQGAFERPVEKPIRAVTFSVENILEMVEAEAEEVQVAEDTFSVDNIIESAPAEAEEVNNVQVAEGTFSDENIIESAPAEAEEAQESTSLNPCAFPYSPAGQLPVMSTDDTPTASSFMPYPPASSSSFVPLPPQLLFFRTPSPDIYIPNYHQTSSYSGPDRRPVQSLPRSKRGGKAPRLRALDRQRKLESSLLETTALAAYDTDVSKSQALERQRMLEASILRQTPSMTFDSNAPEIPSKSGYGAFPPSPPLTPLKSSIPPPAVASEEDVVSDANEHEPTAPRKGPYDSIWAPPVGSRKVVREERERANSLLNFSESSSLISNTITSQAGGSSNVDVLTPGPSFSPPESPSTSISSQEVAANEHTPPSRPLYDSIWAPPEGSRKVVREERERADSLLHFSPPLGSPLIPQTADGSLNVDEPTSHLSSSLQSPTSITLQAADLCAGVDEPTSPKKGLYDSIRAPKGHSKLPAVPSSEERERANSLLNSVSSSEPPSSAPTSVNLEAADVGAGVDELDSPKQGLYDSMWALEGSRKVPSVSSSGEREKAKSSAPASDCETRTTGRSLSTSLRADGGAKRVESARRGQRGRGIGRGRGRGS